MQYTSITGADATVARLRAMARDTGADLLAEIIRAARLCAVSCSRSTQPYGNTKAAQDLGKNAVAKDIRKVFTTPTLMYAIMKSNNAPTAASFWKARTKQDPEGMRKAMVAQGYNISISLLPVAEIHDRARDSHGHVKTNGVRQMVTQAGALNAYIKIRQARVGFAKSGWARAAEQLGGARGIPAWAGSKQTAAQGTAIVVSDPIKPKATIVNQVRYIDQVISPAEIERAVEIAYERLFKQLSLLAKKPRRLVA